MTDGDPTGPGGLSRPKPQPSQPDEEKSGGALGPEQHLSVLIQAVVDYAIYMLDAEGRVATWNSGAQRIKGYLPSEIIGQPFHNFYTPEDRAAGVPVEALRAAREQGKFAGEGWRVRKDGTRFWANVVIDPIWSETGELLGYAKVTRDVTERRETERQLEEAREALFQSRKMEAIGQLTAGIAHDFNNLLAGIIGAMQLIRRRVEAQRFDDIQKYLDAATSSANRAASLTARLLAFGRRQYLDLQVTDINEVAASLEDLLHSTLGEDIAVEFDLDADLPLARTDRNQLESAILNLVINARDAMPGGGRVTIRTRSESAPAGESAGDYVALSVIDTGHGMTPEVMEKAVEPFFTTKAIGEGTGLGLPMIYGFAQQTGGFLRIRSAPNQGATVTMYLPAAPAGARPATAPSPPLEPGDGETVLVVEDDDTVRLLIIDLLRDLGYASLEAGDAHAALPFLDSPRRIDLLVTDIGLPGGTNGRQLAEIARGIRPKMPVLLITGYAGAAASSDMLSPGMDLIAKPFQVEALAAKIHDMVNRAP